MLNAFMNIFLPNFNGLQNICIKMFPFLKTFAGKLLNYKYYLFIAPRSNFDSRTFSRSSGNRALLNRTYEFGDDSDGILSSSPIKFNQTSFYKISSPHLMSDTFDKDLSPGKPIPNAIICFQFLKHLPGLTIIK